MIPFKYMPGFVDNPDETFRSLQALEWERRDDAPRSEYYVNDKNVPYQYGRGRGIRVYHPRSITPTILDIRRKLEDLTGHVFEVCFLNRYLNQRDQLGWHSDDSPEMDDERPIGVISLGCERDIMFRSLDGSETQTVRLGHGSLCLMAPGMQDTHQHRIPKASFQAGERISLTFRGYVS